MTITRIRNGEAIEQTENLALQQNNQLHPWDLADLSLYLHYNCPECNFTSKQDFLFKSHMKENHVTCDSSKAKPEDLIQRFLEEEGLKTSNLEVIENSTMKLPIKSVYDQNPSPWQAKEKNPSNFSVSITKADKTEPELEEDESYLEPLQDLGDLSDLTEQAFLKPDPMEDSKEDIKPKLDKGSKKCQDCSIVFLTSFRLQRHIKKFHGGVTPTMANSDTPIGDDSNVSEMPRPYSCQMCQKSFTSHAYLASHIRKAHEKRFRCEECGKSYGGSSYLREHIEAVHRKTKNFTCESCAATFYSKTQLTNHCLRNHSEGVEKPCVECGKVFTNELSLKLHMRNVHQPVKSMCSQCGKEYPNEVSLKKHVQCVHEKKRPYQCHICSKMFGSKWYVQQHVSKMHEDMQRTLPLSQQQQQQQLQQPSFKCSDCDYEFASIKERNAHVLKTHGKKPTTKKHLQRFANFPPQPVLPPPELMIQSQDLM